MEHWPVLLLLGLMLLMFFVIGLASQKLRLPSVLAYILIGISLSGVITDKEALHTIAEIGIVLLFFLLGLDFPLHKMMDIAKKIWPAGLMDVALNFGVAMLIGLLFGLDIITAFLIGAVVFATSSSITAKMLEDKKRLANAEAEFILALLIFEDLLAPILVSFLVGVYSGTEVTLTFVSILLAKIALLGVGAIIIGYYGFRKLGEFVEEYLERDFMPIFTLAIAFGYAGLALYLGLSEVLGAFLAGVMLTETGKGKDLEHLILPVRDLALPFFFFWFGTSISFGEGVPMVGLLLVLVLWSLAGKLIVGYYGGQQYGLSPRAALRAGFSLAPRGEFSAIIAAVAPPQWKIFSSIYILATAFLGVYFFNKAPAWSKAVHEKYFKKRSALKNN